MEEIDVDLELGIIWAGSSVESVKEFVIGAFLLGCLAILLVLSAADREKKPDQQTCPKICAEYGMAREWSYTSSDIFACVCNKSE